MTAAASTITAARSAAVARHRASEGARRRSRANCVPKPQAKQKLCERVLTYSLSGFFSLGPEGFLASPSSPPSCLARKFFSASDALIRIGNFWKSGAIALSMSTSCVGENGGSAADGGGGGRGA